MKQLNYQQIGTQGEHLVLIHGLFGSLENLNMVAKPLAEKYIVTSVDVRNHGSSFHADDMSYSTLAKDIVGLLDYLNIEHCYLLGHSMGGKIAMQTALEYPERVTKLIVADIAPVTYPPHHQKIIKGLQSIDFTKNTTRKDADKQLSAYVDDAGIRQFLLRNFSKIGDNTGFRCNLEKIALGYSQIMEKITIDSQFQGKTLFIKGGNSDYILAEHQQAITNYFPFAKAKIIQNTGHWLHAEKPIAFNKIIVDFLAT